MDAVQHSTLCRAVSSFFVCSLARFWLEPRLQKRKHRERRKAESRQRDPVFSFERSYKHRLKNAGNSALLPWLVSISFFFFIFFYFGLLFGSIPLETDTDNPSASQSWRGVDAPASRDNASLEKASFTPHPCPTYTVPAAFRSCRVPIFISTEPAVKARKRLTIDSMMQVGEKDGLGGWDA